MKFFHISDLHIGKRVNGFSMLEDQKYILNQILKLTEQERPDGIFLAGDLYDRSTPAAEAVEMADWFLSELADRKIAVWAISGNHDSAERVAYGGRMMERAGVYMSRVFSGSLQKFSLDEKGEATDIWFMPFLRPAQVRRFWPEETVESTQQAIETVLNYTEIDRSRTKVLIMHQFLTGAAVCESEEISVGGSDQVDVSLFDAFDYVALGHLHGPQKVGRDTVRYCGSPLKYSFSEARQKKSVTIVTTHGADKTIEIDTIPLAPLHDLREIMGPMEELLKPAVYLEADREDYLHITLTDKEEILDAIGRLREVYPNIMRLDFAMLETEQIEEDEIRPEEKTPQELFAEFFLKQNGYEISEEQKEIADRLLEQLTYRC